MLQIHEQRHRRHYVEATVQLREHQDGTLGLHHGPPRLADYTAGGSLISEKEPARSAA